MDIVNLLILLGCVILSEIKTFPCCIFLNGNHKKIKIARVPLEEERKIPDGVRHVSPFPTKKYTWLYFCIFFVFHGKIVPFFLLLIDTRKKQKTKKENKEGKMVFLANAL